MGKHPLLPTGVYAATSEEKKICQFWQQYPKAGIGIATGPVSNLLVIDVDPRNGGELSFDALPINLAFDDDYRVQTGGGGFHLYFKYPCNYVGKINSTLAPGIDVKGRGGYVVAPPSIHMSGRDYAWCGDGLPDFKNPPAFPPVLLTMLTSIKVRETNTQEISQIGEGRRNQFLVSVAGSLRKWRINEKCLGTILEHLNQTVCNPPVTALEIRAITKSALRWS